MWSRLYSAANPMPNFNLSGMATLWQTAQTMPPANWFSIAAQD
jgi:hypothetical protein